MSILKKSLKYLLRFLIVLFILSILYIGFTFYQVYSAAHHEGVYENTHADAIVVLGAAQYNGKPSPVLQGRLKHALKLYEQGRARVIVVTGGKQQGDKTTEASASANWLLERGVKDENILREVRSHSTYDSFRDLSVFAETHYIRTIIVVTDGFHMKRSLSIAHSFGFIPIGSPVKESAISPSKERQYFITETARLSLGRIIGFRRVSRDSSLAGFIK